MLTTHDLGDIEELCQRVIIIDTGQLIYDGPLSTIKARFGKYREITFETLRDGGEVDMPPGAEVTAQAARTLTVRFDRTQTTASQVAAAVMTQLEVKDFSLAEPDLAAIIKQIYQGALHEVTA
jgi:ABC-2 type transport system ATP-binding protein